MPSVATIRRQVTNESRLIDLINAQFAGQLDEVKAGLDANIRRLLLELETQDGRLVASKASLGRALQLRTGIQQALADAGYPDLAMRAVDEPLDTLAVQVLKGRSIAAQAADLTPIDLDALGALKDIRFADLLQLGDQISTALWRSTVDGVLGLRPVNDLVDELAAVTDVSTRQARTLHDTAVSSYGRSVEQLGLPGEGSDRFLYIGPDDTETRPFCEDRVGQVFTRDEISEMDNGQLPNVLLTGGGYNCRHAWKFVGTLSLNDLEAQ